MSLNPLTWPVAGKLAAIIGGSVLVVGGATAALVAIVHSRSAGALFTVRVEWRDTYIDPRRAE